MTRIDPTPAEIAAECKKIREENALKPRTDDRQTWVGVEGPGIREQKVRKLGQVVRENE